MFGREEQVAVEAPEVARDALARDDVLDPIDGGGMAFRGQPRAALAVQALDCEKPVVDRIDEVRGRGAGHAAADRPILQDDDGLPNLGKQIGSGETRDTGADDADVSGGVGGQW